MITLFTAALAGIMVVLGVQAVPVEETKGRAEPVLATATSRGAWFGGYLAVISIGLVGLLLVAGFATGVGTAISLSGRRLLHLGRHRGAPGACAGRAGPARDRRSTRDGAGSPIVGTQRVAHGAHRSTSLDSISWPATTILLMIAATLAAAGLAGFRLRDLETK